MKLDLSQIFDGSVCNLEIDETLNIDTSDEKFQTESNIRLKSAVNIAGNIYASENGAYLEAKLTYEYVENCARCLTEFSEKAENTLTAKIIEKSKEQTEQDEDEIIIYYDEKDSVLDIEETILASIELAKPMKPLCGENCEGLCSICGVDLNVEKCNCTKQDIDPRLEKLKDLLD